MKILHWLRKEGKAILILTLYFFFCYGMLVILKKLILLHYNISFFGFGAAVLGALISAKAVLIVESTPLAKILRESAPALKVIYDCLLYTTLALILLYAEKTFEIWHQEGTLRMAFFTVGKNEGLSVFCATVIWAGLAFLGYAIFAAIGRHLGHGELIRLFFTPRKNKTGGGHQN